VHPYEQAEALEQLRALTVGIPIRIAVLDKAPGHGVDTEPDLARAEDLLSRPTRG
jgi:3-deoxy-manno-octulosonate cytidylyltransferase (CMP-KDO synthetase)